jgi:transcriptional regulator with GAF, ATPase, and Fis domain
MVLSVEKQGRGSVEIDNNRFFREATLRICSSLDPEIFLFSCFEYVRGFVPLDMIVLCHYYPDQHKHVVLASATAEGGFLLNYATTETDNGHSYILKTRESESDVVITDQAETHPSTQELISTGAIPKQSSMLTLMLRLEGAVVGAVSLFARGHNRYNRKHAGIISLLKHPLAIALSNSIRYQELKELKELLTEENRFFQSELRQIAGEEIIGADFGLRSVMQMARQVAPLSSPVLLLGETGTGKEVIANAIHQLSSRSSGPFIKVNCGAIPQGLVDSELFGHEKGAFTGATQQKRGRFERAKGGTIFLDEVAELHPGTQVRLLRVLQEKVIERVGGTEPIVVDIRVIAATHRDLDTLIRSGQFREDLYYRLKVFPIVIPPLRERKPDVPSLVHHFIRKKSLQMGLNSSSSLAPGALESLMEHDWPGNVRELENVVERALVLSRGQAIAFNDLTTSRQSRSSLARTGSERPEGQSKEPLSQKPLSLDEVMTAHILRVMEMTGGKIGGNQGAAELLQINPSTLRKRMRKLGISFGRKAKAAKKKPTTS